MHNFSVFKYFGQKQHLESFARKGEVMFNTLLYFLSCEDEARRDYLEDSNIYRPSNGLQITLTKTQQKLTDPRALISKVKNPHRVFIFCSSTENSDYLYKKFSAVGCVEIFNLNEFKKRVLRAIKQPIHNIKNQTLLADTVSYYDHEQESGTRHACPDQIIMSKLMNFSEEKEFRFAFAKDKNAFDVNNVDYLLSSGIVPSNLAGNGKKLTLGDLTDIVRVIR
jgi:hypothetical protein